MMGYRWWHKSHSEAEIEPVRQGTSTRRTSVASWASCVTTSGWSSSLPPFSDAAHAARPRLPRPISLGFEATSQPTDRRVTDAERSRDVDQGLARISSCHGFLPRYTFSLGGRPIWTPRALARARPSPVRARINSRSNSASPPSTV
jgi:hypothetical protein